MDLTYESDQEMEKAVPAIRLRVDVRLVRTPAGAGPPAHRKRRSQAGRASLRRAFLRLLDASLRAGSESDRPHVSHGRPPLTRSWVSRQGPFTGTEPGTVIDIFVPTMMHPGATRDDWNWHPHAGAAEAWRGSWNRFARNSTQSLGRSKRSGRRGSPGMPKQMHRSDFSRRQSMLEPAAAGASALQTEYRAVLLVDLGVLVALCAAYRLRERGEPDDGSGRGAGPRDGASGLDRRRTMAFGATGAGGKRDWLAFLAAAAGRGVRVVVGAVRRQPGSIRRTIRRACSFPADWRVLGFGLALDPWRHLACLVCCPALRASAVKPASALKGGEDPHSRRRLMHALIAVQVAFCFLVLFVAGLFAATFDRLSHQPIGFSAERLSDAGYCRATRSAAARALGSGGGTSCEAMPGVRGGGAGGVAAARRGRLEQLRFD